jgi:hypothetical protein
VREGFKGRNGLLYWKFKVKNFFLLIDRWLGLFILCQQPRRRNTNSQVPGKKGIIQIIRFRADI